MLLVGPPRSGKSSRILSDITRSLQEGSGDEVKLIVPNNGMVNYLTYRLTRDKLVVPQQTIVSINALVRKLTPGVDEPSKAESERLLRRAIKETAQHQFPGRGHRQAITTLMQEFWAAGKDSSQARDVARTPAQKAFCKVFQKYEALLEEKGYLHGGQRFAKAADTIRKEGLGPVTNVYMDGFMFLTKPQEKILEALNDQATLLAAFPNDIGISLPKEHQQEKVEAPASKLPDIKFVEARHPRDEVMEIALRILENQRNRQKLSDHGIIARNLGQYRNLLVEVLSTLNIPFILRETKELAQHGVARHLRSWLQAIQDGLPTSDVLPLILSPLSPAGGLEHTDQFDFAARKHMTKSDARLLELLHTSDLADILQHCPELNNVIDSVRDTRNWPHKKQTAQDWCIDCCNLLNAVTRRDTPEDDANLERILNLKERNLSLRALRKAIRSTAELSEFQVQNESKEAIHISYPAFCEALDDVLDMTPFDMPDYRKDVVYILDIHEARHWSLPVVFLCGLADGWFPAVYRQEPFFDDNDRRWIEKTHNIKLRNNADHQIAESALYNIAETRARKQLVLSRPILGTDQKPLRPSPFLEKTLHEWNLHKSDCQHKRMGSDTENTVPKPVATLATAEEGIETSPSKISTFRSCPYKHFARHTLKLEARPVPPEQRLDMLAIGSLVHQVLHEWTKNGQSASLATILDGKFDCMMENLPMQHSFETELTRRVIHSNLARLQAEADKTLPPFAASETVFEWICQLHLDDPSPGVTVYCRIDRCDIDEEGNVFVTDYKYSNKASDLLKETKSIEELQLPLYAMAALQSPQTQGIRGLRYLGLKDKVSCYDISLENPKDDLPGIMANAREQITETLQQIGMGDIRVLPTKSDCYNRCDFSPVCRIRWPGFGTLSNNT